MVNGLTVAVKVSADGVLAAREAAVIRAAGPVAGTVLGSGRLEGGGSWMASPWWHGSTLVAEFTDARKQPADPAARRRAASAAADAASAVAELHAAGWAHGDVQAEHFIHTPYGVRLLDLAWAHSLYRSLPAGLDAQYAGALVHLEAPEIARALLNGQPVTPTPQADVYALAGALWACWTGTWPVNYEAAGVDPAPGDLEPKRRAVASGRWLRTIETPQWENFGVLLWPALAPRPEDRATARALAEELDRLAEKEAVQ
jgi:hypothetical protein